MHQAATGITVTYTLQKNKGGYCPPITFYYNC